MLPTFPYTFIKLTMTKNSLEHLLLKCNNILKSSVKDASKLQLITNRPTSDINFAFRPSIL